MAPKKTFVVHGFKCSATMDRANSLLLTVSVGASSKDWPRKRLNKDVDLEAAAAQLIVAATSPQPEASVPDASCSEAVEGQIDVSAGHCCCVFLSQCFIPCVSRMLAARCRWRRAK